MQSILPLPLQISEDKDKGSEKGNNGNEADDVCVDNKRGPQEDRVGAEASSKFRHLIDELKWLFTTREGLIGEYDYIYLLTPNIPPWNRKYKHKVQPFYGIHDRIPLLLTFILGVQHALSMIGGIVAPPLLVAGQTGANLPPRTVAYLVSVSLMLSGFFSIFQIARFRVWRTNTWIGTGMLSVVGEAFSIVPVATAFFDSQYRTGKCPSTTIMVEEGPEAGTTHIQKEPCPEAYGKLLGTIAVVFLMQIIISLIVKPKVLMKIFPPLVSGMVMCCIGAQLVGSGMKNWAGGTACMTRPEAGPHRLCPDINAPNPKPWGHPSLVGLGFSVYITILLIERFGSPLLRNASIVVGLAIGTIISAATGYITTASIRKAAYNQDRQFTFLWVETFPLGFSISLVVPLMAACISSMVSCMGDIVATADVSNLEIVSADSTNDNPTSDIHSRVQGGLTADGIWSVLAALATSTPLTIFAQNNGVIALTSCASLRSGYMCCILLILAGIITVPSTIIVALPPSVIGGMTTFLFTSIFVSGLRILSLVRWDRRNRFIATAALTIALADLVVPNWADYLLPGYGPGPPRGHPGQGGGPGKGDGSGPGNGQGAGGGGGGGGRWGNPGRTPQREISEGLYGFYEGLEVLLKTSYCIVAFIGCFLVIIMPESESKGAQESREEGKSEAETGTEAGAETETGGGVAEGLGLSDDEAMRRKRGEMRRINASGPPKILPVHQHHGERDRGGTKVD